MPISPDQKQMLIECLAAVRYHDAREYMQYSADDPWQAFIDDYAHRKPLVPEFDKVAHHDARNKTLVKLLFETNCLAEKIRPKPANKGQIAEDQKAVLVEVLDTIKWHEAHNVMQYKCDDPWEAYGRDHKKDVVAWRLKLCLNLVRLLYTKGLLAERLVAGG